MIRSVLYDIYLLRLQSAANGWFSFFQVKCLPCASAHSPLLDERILSDSYLSLKYMFSMICIINLP